MRLFALFCIIVAQAHAASLAAIGLAVCGCPSCLVTNVVIGSFYQVVNYGNASASVFDWLGAARDFFPAPTVLNSSESLDCANSTAFLLNGTDLLAQLAFVQTSPSQCFLNLSAAGNGDWALAVAVHSPNATLSLFQPDPAAPVPLISFEGASAALPLVAGPQCTLPDSFEFCGTNFSRSGCFASGSVYDGECFNDDMAIPLGCHGNPLFKLAVVVAAQCGQGCKLAFSLGAVLISVLLFSLSALFVDPPDDDGKKTN